MFLIYKISTYLVLPIFFLILCLRIILKKETSLGLESFEDLGFNSEEELELEISKLTKFRPEFDTNME